MDKLEEMFSRQTEFMKSLLENDKMVEWPVDLATKPGQRLIKECIFNMIEELAEASFTLKNKMHKISDDRHLDLDHYKEEMCDALAFWMEVCILSGFTPKEMFEEYCRKNAIVHERLKNGY